MQCSCLWKSEEGVRHPGAGVTSGCDLPGVGAENHTQSPLHAQPVLLTTEPCLHLFMMEQATERKTGCQPGLPFPGEGLWAWKDFCSSIRPSKYWGFVFLNQGTGIHLAQHRVDLVCDFNLFCFMAFFSWAFRCLGGLENGNEPHSSAEELGKGCIC